MQFRVSSYTSLYAAPGAACVPYAELVSMSFVFQSFAPYAGGIQRFSLFSMRAGMRVHEEPKRSNQRRWS